MAHESTPSLDLPALFGPDMLADPYPVYHRLRSVDPVHWHGPFDAWVLTRYDDVLAGLHDPRFSADRTAARARRVLRASLVYLPGLLALLLLDRALGL